MHWVLQENIFNEEAYDGLLDVLERFGIPYSQHKVVPFIGELIPDPEPQTDRIICFGSFSMRHYAKKMGYYPGVFDLFEQDFMVQMEQWGDEMLNADSKVVKFKDARLSGATFVRPVNDTKHFAGKVFWPEDFHEWQDKVCNLGEDYGMSLTPDTLIQLSSPKEIYREVRYWVVKGRVATSSVYKIADKIIYQENTDTVLDEYVEKMIAAWQPAEAFVIDVCLTDNGCKIVEINTINACGLYAADLQKLVFSLEEAFGDTKPIYF